MDRPALIVKHSIIRIVGVFEAPKHMARLRSQLKDNNYVAEEISDPNALNFLKNYWYPDFRNMYFLSAADTSAKIYTRNLNESVDFIIGKDKNTSEEILLNATVSSAELFLFRDQLNFFTVELQISKHTLADYSDLMNKARNFDSEIRSEGKGIKWVNWIEKHILCGIRISSHSSEGKVKVDDYSGSKFKLFTVLDLKEPVEPNIRTELLYDVGSVAKIGSAGGNSPLTPSPSYFDELMENKVSVFNNYDILPLLDSFTVLGNDLLEPDPSHFKNITWKQTYFRIFIHNLFIKFNLFRYNSEMIHDSVSVRDKFESFLNTYNLSHISYNFLPNLIYRKHRASLDIDAELIEFQQRINRISQSIQEKEQKRSNQLLGLVGVLTSISSAEPVYSFLEKTRDQLQWSYGLYYLSILAILILAAMPLILFLFPDKRKKWLKKMKRR